MNTKFGKINRLFLPNWIVISGNGRNVGKTWLACRLIEYFSRSVEVNAFKISPHFHSLAKGDVDDFFWTTEKKSDTGKDSSKMLKAGASKVFYIESKNKGLINNIQLLIDLSENKPVICESGGISSLIKPGILIYIENKEYNDDKLFAGNADILLEYYEGKVYFDVCKLKYENNCWIHTN